MGACAAARCMRPNKLWNWGQAEVTQRELLNEGQLMENGSLFAPMTIGRDEQTVASGRSNSGRLNITPKPTGHRPTLAMQCRWQQHPNDEWPICGCSQPTLTQRSSTISQQKKGLTTHPAGPVLCGQQTLCPQHLNQKLPRHFGVTAQTAMENQWAVLNHNINQTID